MLAQRLPHGSAQGAGSLAVNDAHGREAGHVGVVQVLFERGKGFLHGHAAQVEFPRGPRPLPAHHPHAGGQTRGRRLLLGPSFQFRHAGAQAQGASCHFGFVAVQGHHFGRAPQRGHPDAVPHLEGSFRRGALLLNFRRGRARGRQVLLFDAPQLVPQGGQLGHLLAIPLQPPLHGAQQGAHLFQFCAGFLAGLVQHFCPLLLDAGQPFLQLLSEGFRLAASALGLTGFLLGPLAGHADVGQQRLQLQVLVREELPGSLHNFRVQPQALGDVERVGAPRQANEEPIGGPQGFQVELHTGVLHARRVVGPDFEFGVVGGDDGADRPFHQVGEDGARQRSPLHRVGAGADFVNEHQ